MKKAASILAGLVGVLSLMALMPIASYAMADTVFAKVVPSETQALDSSEKNMYKGLVRLSF